MPALRVVTVPVLSDNYAYLVVDEESRTAAAVDPAEADKVVAAAAREGVRLSHVLTTHCHWDHAGGNADMVRLCPGIEVVGGRGDNAAAVTHEVGDGDVVRVGGLSIGVLYTPCHTPGHVTFVAEDPGGGPKCVFTGDTLFVAGCGNFNAGTPQQMYTALIEKIGALSADSLIYCGHEYTEKNLMYAQTAEPDNQAIRDKLDWVRSVRSAGQPTVPSTLADEWKTNPFMRCGEPSMLAYTGETDAVKSLAVVRARKSAWRP
eukprot:Tamp_23300.p1 GENE.Tamp_23300~~Tamp_23300.p1  ORF type:complete len:288 (+),score=48.22 Tamp_23300:82-864(+)